MTNQEIINTSAERYFCEKLDAKKFVPMKEEDTKTLLTLSLMQQSADAGKEDVTDIIKELSKAKDQNLACKIIETRLAGLGYNVHLLVLIFLSTLLESPGEAVMYAHYMAYKAKKHGKKDIDLNFLCMDIFPWGFPTKEDLSEVWDGQKIYRIEELNGLIEGDNLLDRADANISISYGEKEKEQQL